MERHGWRAIIYDAPWAKFKTGQTGVIVSEDRRSCETVDDDKSSIIIEADQNTTLEDRSNGHVLFRQKGSGLFDIVCLYQGAGGTYELIVKDFTVDGCVGISYAEFIKKLEVYEVKNGVSTKVPNTDEGYNFKKSILVKPTAIDASNNFINNTESPVEYDIKVENGGAVGTAKLTSTAADEEYYDYSYTYINGINKITIEKISNGTSYCNIYLSGGNTKGDCTGGTVTFGLNSGYSTNPTYKINLAGLSATYVYNIVKCGVIDQENQHTENGSVTVSVIEKDGVEVIEKGEDYIIISVISGISSVDVLIAPEKGNTELKTLTIN